MKLLKKNLLIFSLFMITLLITTVGCSATAEDAQAENKLEEIQASGKLVLGTSADYPPYEFYAEIDGELQIVGFDIDIAKEIAKDMGVELEIVDMQFDGLLAALVADNIDMIVAGMAATEERKESVDFSTSYYEAEQTMLVRKEDYEKFQSISDLEDHRIGVQMATVQEGIAQEQVSNAKEIKSLGKISDLVLELNYGNIDSIILVDTVAMAYAENNEDLTLSQISFGKEDGVAAAVAKGHEEFLASVNQTLERLIADGSIDQFIEDAVILADQQNQE
ncbi:transporter substrate-binding domain-containing protein [Isachenkonia alkalipeptolytica]|uniref:Transporter substrate-binding domain-containing protein n=1 Tax=Isachenkonia alkalipeptolytica TaxID=2565777 RepID=A0AA44BDR7_9CLOT|nr:transporter substrate-binding domain-containing protein [Isachenkonia alkalipeptolytica]NBG88604.1 transporter substrate-binding domain-containing protein [Isachenkonia alkalipeptolytica]